MRPSIRETYLSGYAQQSIFSGGVSPHPESIAPYVVEGMSVQSKLLTPKQVTLAQKARQALIEILNIDEKLSMLHEGRDRYGLKRRHAEYLAHQLIYLVSIEYALHPNKKEMQVLREAVQELASCP